MSEPNITLGYWGIRGLAAPLRMMLMYKNVPFKCECYDIKEKPEGGTDASSWFTTKAGLKARNPLINLPYLIDGDLIISQSCAIMGYLGRKHGMMGNTEAEAVMCDQLLDELMDLRNKMTTFCYSTPTDADVAKAAKTVLDQVQNPNMGSLAKLEAVMAANTAGNDTFLVGGHATAPDFHLFELFEQYSALAKFFGYDDPFANLPHLRAFHTNFAALPDNARYLASPLHTKLPFNNKMAVFGAVPGGGRWSPGTACDWHDLSGVF